LSISKEGFSRYKCRKCGARFWSMIPRETCPDKPCSKYDFLFKEYPGVKKLDLDEARNSFIEYFKSKGHGYIEPYPVLARWRNDLYLTIASIIVFQPMVTEGLIEPPYNPLVIVQPSIRLEDIDNVGLTFGRHLTSFEMGGHHAFNRRNKYVYWIDETIMYAYEYFTKVIGIKPEDLVFKESWWEGGGNAGPALEVLVDGLELATLVFMKYKIVNGKYIDNPVLVVDTGYGIERIAWFTQRKPTSYHVIFGDLINEYKSILGVEEPPYNVLKKIAYILSDQEIMNIDHLVELINKVGYGEYSRETIASINTYTLLDHGRTLLLMLSDGIVPSNTGEGYLARLVLRRMLRTLLRLNIDVSRLEDIVLELLFKQAMYWKNKYIYDKFHKHLNYINEVISLETRKFIDNITRGVDIVDKIIRRKKKIDVNDLIEIYDSRGIPPEIIVERASKYGLEIKMPSDFYAKIAELHGGSRALVKEKEYGLPREIVEWARSFDFTKPIFHKKPYASRYVARVVGIKDRYVVFDKTIFYPKAGGQDDDKGYIIYGDKKYDVVNVYKVGDVVVHELNIKPDLSVGDEVEQYINWIRRYRLMRHHTATHILLGVLRKVLGDHVWQAGVEKTVDKARLDITHYKPLSRDELLEIEREANRIIDEHLDVKFHYLDKFDAEKRFGLRIYQGGAIYSPILRIVEIPGVDVEACFGTHVYNTSEVGGIKILKAEKIQDGVIRLEFSVATKLPEYLSSMIDEKERALKILGMPHGDLVSIARRIKDMLDKNRDIILSYRNEFKNLLLERVEREKEKLCNTWFIVIEKKIDDQQLYKSILEELALKKKYITVLYGKDYLEIAIDPNKAKESNIDLRIVVNELKNRIEGAQGGGKRDHIIIKIYEPRKTIDMIKKLLKNSCKE